MTKALCNTQIQLSHHKWGKMMVHTFLILFVSLSLGRAIEATSELSNDVSKTQDLKSEKLASIPQSPTAAAPSSNPKDDFEVIGILTDASGNPIPPQSPGQTPGVPPVYPQTPTYPTTPVYPPPYPSYPSYPSYPDLPPGYVPVLIYPDRYHPQYPVYNEIIPSYYPQGNNLRPGNPTVPFTPVQSQPPSTKFPWSGRTRVTEELTQPTLPAEPTTSTTAVPTVTRTYPWKPTKYTPKIPAINPEFGASSPSTHHPLITKSTVEGFAKENMDPAIVIPYFVPSVSA